MSDTGTVLVVEDQPDLAKAYSEILSTQYDVRTALSGEEALEIVDNDVDVVLLDRRMPGMSGDEVLAKFVERGIAVKVAMLTAVEPDVDIVDMPFDDYKTKPVNNNELLGLVEVLMQRAEYDNKSQKLFRLAAKKATLESAGKEDTEAYRQLTSRLSELRGEVDQTLEGVSPERALQELDI
jgi:DNA-binding response OmpR family regulator